MKKRLKSKIALSQVTVAGAFWLGFASLASPAFATDSSVSLETLKTHSRIVIHVDENVTSEWKTSAQGFELLLKGIGLGDLGASLGEEEKWVSQFAHLKDPRVSSLRFTEGADGVRVFGKWRFPNGAAALAEPKMESFEYRDQSPSSLVVDFWLKPGPTLAQATFSRRQAQRLAAIQKAEKEVKDRAARRIASEKIKAEEEDVGRFCRLPYTEETDVFLPFYPLHEGVDFSRWISTTTPDHRFYYYEPQSPEKDAQYVRLALDLYRKGKFALVLRTLDFFEQDFRETSYRSEMRFLRANTLLKLHMQREAEELLVEIMNDAQSSPVALHSAMYIAGKRATQNSHLAALEPFLWLISHHPEHRLSWIFHLGAAEAFFGMKQTERAAKEYQWVVEHAPERHNRAEAAVRLGDLYLERFQYEQALAAYFQGLNYFGKEADDFPSIFINRAEALYGVGQFDRAKEAFLDFLTRFPGHPAGWRATYRLGEITGRGTEPREGQDSRKWFSETINHYPFSAGAHLARLQLLPCGDRGGLTFEASEKIFESEAASFTGNGDVVMLRYPEFKGLARIRSLIAWSREDLAVAVAVQESLVPRTSETRPALIATLQILFRRQILKLIDAGKKYEALAFYQEKSTYLPKSARYAEPEYLLKLSQAASDLGMGKLGEELAGSFREATASQSGRAVAGVGSTSPEISADPSQLKLIAEQNYSEAKAAWVQRGLGAEKLIREKLAQVNEASPFSFEREVILGLIEEKSGHAERALPHVAKAQLLRPVKKVGAEDLRLDSWLARLQTESGEPALAYEMNRRLEEKLSQAASDNSSEILTVLGVQGVSSVEQLVLAQAGLLDKLQRWGEAATAYARSFEKGMGGSQARFGHARALMHLSGAESQEKGLAILKEMSASKNNDLWKKLAGEALQNVELEKKSKKNQAKEGLK